MNKDGKAWWATDCITCPHERVHQIEYRQLDQNLNELKTRVGRVETTLARGVLLLVANLAGVVITLLRAYIDS